MQGSLKLAGSRASRLACTTRGCSLSLSSPRTVIVGGVSRITIEAPALSMHDFVFEHTLRRGDCALVVEAGQLLGSSASPTPTPRARCLEHDLLG
jgi:hypothetical protein